MVATFLFKSLSLYLKEPNEQKKQRERERMMNNDSPCTSRADEQLASTSPSSAAEPTLYTAILPPNRLESLLQGSFFFFFTYI